MFLSLSHFKSPPGRRSWPPWLPIMVLLAGFLVPLSVTRAADPIRTDLAAKINPDESQSEFFYCRTGLCMGDLEAPAWPAAYATAVYNGDLIVGGYFGAADGNPVKSIARWDGAAWHDLGGGVSRMFYSAVNALTVYDGELIAAGKFDTAGSVPAQNIAAWNGTSWHALGEGIRGEVKALCVYDGLLIAAGDISIAGTVSIRGVAAWNGSEWADLPGISSSVWVNIDDVIAYNGQLIAVGTFDTPPGRIATWNGSSWSTLGSGINGQAYALAVFNGTLIVGGSFTTATQSPGNLIVGWDGDDWFQVVDSMSDNDTQYGPVVACLGVYQNRLIAGGVFTDVNGLQAQNIAA